jgi:hypothetical protein
MDVHSHPQSDLLQVIQALSHPGFLLAARQRRQEHTREDADDPDHYQQLDQRERRTVV